VPLRGFLSYLVRVTDQEELYTIIGYKGKQVRDLIHSEDVVRAFEAVYADPRPGEVYSLGGGRENSTSILELIDRLEQLTGRRIERRYEEKARVADHIAYISNLAKLRAHYPGSELTRSLEDIVVDVYHWVRRL
jgi:CDP-paratose 2-epimerase